MVKARIPGSSQELYTVSVESMPQYVNNSGRSGRMMSSACCKGGRVGKDLLCGVLIALAVICAAVAIFLVVYYVVNNNNGGDQQLPTIDGAANNNDTLDSSPLTRHREEESKLNALGNGKNNNDNWDHHHHDHPDHDHDKDHHHPQQSDVGIHEPEFHVEGVKVYPPSYGGQPEPSSTTVSSSTSTTEKPAETTTTTTPVSQDVKLSSPSPVTLMDVEEKSQDIAKKSETTLFVPDDDAIIETPSGVDEAAEARPSVPLDDVPSPSSSSNTSTTESSAVVVPETSGFVPIRPDEGHLEGDEEFGEQTEAAPEIPRQDSKLPPAVDTAPWKPIHQADAVEGGVAAQNNASSDIAPRFIQEDTAGQIQGIPSIISTSEKSPAADEVSPDPSIADDSSVPAQPEEGEEEEESTEFALTQNLGDMAILVPEDRIRTTTTTTTSSSSPSSPSSTTISPSATNSSSTITTDIPTSTTASAEAEPIIQLSNKTDNNNQTSSPFRIAPLLPPVLQALQPAAAECIRRQLPFCKGVLPYSETILPNWVGDKTEGDRNLSVPYFEIIAESECHPRVQQYACAVLEPPCRDKGVSLPPCRQFCRAIAEDCRSYVLSALTLSSVLDCDRFPQSNDPNVCINLASTTPEGECLPGEYRCSSDNTCIPERWVCDGRQDCSQGDDEFSCGQCTDQEFKCESEPNRCLPQRWRCDGSKDCADGSDERDCPANQECGDGQFRCEDGLSCIPLRRVCDGSNHCRDNSDEVNCTSVVCQNDDFKCKENGVCIPRQWICDNNWDCKDGSDEVDCPLNDAELLDDSDSSNSSSEQLNESSSGNSTAFNPEKCPLGELLCISDMSCIRFEQLCDGTKDCSDGADETDCSSD